VKSGEETNATKNQEKKKQKTQAGIM